MNFENRSLTDDEADAIIQGVQSGEVDAVDLRCIAENARAWIMESDSDTAVSLRVPPSAAEPS